MAGGGSGSGSGGGSASSKRSNGKVGQACIFCRRSHMTCDAGRPCQRCIKRDIGHLCRDEKTSRGSSGGGGGGNERASVGAGATGVRTARRSSTHSRMSESPAPAVSAPPTSAPLPASAIINVLIGNGAARMDPMMGAGPSMHPINTGQIMGAGGADVHGARGMAFNDVYQANAVLQQAAASAGALPSSATTNNWVASMLGGASFLGLGGGDPIGGGNGFAASGDAAGGNEFNILSEFLESLDGAGPGTSGYATPSAAATLNVDGSVSSTARPQQQAPSQRITRSTAADAGANVAADGQSNEKVGAQANHSLTRNRRASLIEPSGVGNNKTETFLLTAADQKDGTRDERLGRVIQAKLDAGLLRPYNHVKGYARLNQWMEQNCSQVSRRRILKPLSIFRPAFRSVAQRLTNVDLIFIEEAFERLLLDYDRLFSTQGIPACLWRRTGEIYKGNKEFADLVGVEFDALRDGHLTIYELMQEESAVNYWEKYGAVCFDPGQKAVLTSCVLKTSGNGKKRSAAARSGIQTPASAILGTGAPQTAATTAPGSTATSSKAATPAPAASFETQQPDNKEVAMKRAGSQQSPTKKRKGAANREGETSTTTANTPAATTPAATTAALSTSFDDDALSCCFSFTIRRDAWGIPYAIVGNFLPLVR